VIGSAIKVAKIATEESPETSWSSCRTSQPWRIALATDAPKRRSHLEIGAATGNTAYRVNCGDSIRGDHRWSSRRNVALFSLGVTFLNVGREMLWPKTATAPEWLAVIVLVAGGMVVLGSLFIGLRLGPKSMRAAVDSWPAPEDAKLYPDMRIRMLLERVCPHPIEGASPKIVPEGEWARCGDLLVELQQHGRLSRLQLLGQEQGESGIGGADGAFKDSGRVLAEGHARLSRILEGREGQGRAKRLPWREGVVRRHLAKQAAGDEEGVLRAQNLIEYSKPLKRVHLMRGPPVKKSTTA
jgi:hypothetical protein